MMLVSKKIKRIRRQMRRNKLAAWIINGFDPHNSEYVCEHWQSRKWVSGFTGSAGTVVITKNQALIWVDSRYYVQCEKQIADTPFEMRKIDGPEASSPVDFLRDSLPQGARVGIDAETITLKATEVFKDKKVNLVPCDDILDKVWKDRPAIVENPVVELPETITGESAESKIGRIREAAAKDGATHVLVSSLDDIAWTLNLRGSDVEDTPVFLSYLLIGPDYVKLFTSEERFADYVPDDAVMAVLRLGKIDDAIDGLAEEKQEEPEPEKERCYQILPYGSITSEIAKIKGGVIAFDPSRINMKLYSAVRKFKKVEISDYSTMFKACKNPVEMEGMRKSHILDGVAFVNFMAKVDTKEARFTEVSIAKALEEERAKSEDYLGPSFSTIAGFGANGAVVHYSATEETDQPISGNGLLVLDSGAQYTFGTTDVTRTLIFGRPSREQKEDYTLVLKGHLALAGSVFPEGTTGHQLDVLAHGSLWQHGMTYYHGTGHGVGHRLSVHEGPQRISTVASSVALKEGMVISDEPGVYKENKHGVRIENLIAVKPAMETEFGKFLSFENLTCCPYELRLIARDLLSAAEIKKINAYHRWVWDCLKGLVTPEGREWLKRATMPL